MPLHYLFYANTYSQEICQHKIEFIKMSESIKRQF